MKTRVCLKYFAHAHVYNVKHCYGIRKKFGEKFLTSLTNSVLRVKASICSTIKETLHYGKFPAFVIIVII